MGMLSRGEAALLPSRQPARLRGRPHPALLLRRCGGFSVWREGMDRQSLLAAVDVLTEADRPLVVAPEGVLTRTNDRLLRLMDGVAFMARTAAKHRADANVPAGVVMHATVIKYFFDGDIRAALEPTLTDSGGPPLVAPGAGMPLAPRIQRLGEGLLAVKEVEYYGQARTGPLHDRVTALINHLLVPLEKEWLNGRAEGDATERVKKLRIAIVPTLIAGVPDEAEHPVLAAVGRHLPDPMPGACTRRTTSSAPDRRAVDGDRQALRGGRDRPRARLPAHAGRRAGGRGDPRLPHPRARAGGDPLMQKLTASMQSILDGLIAESRPLTDVF